MLILQENKWENKQSGIILKRQGNMIRNIGQINRFDQDYNKQGVNSWSRLNYE